MPTPEYAAQFRGAGISKIGGGMSPPHAVDNAADPSRHKDPRIVYIAGQVRHGNIADSSSSCAISAIYPLLQDRPTGICHKISQSPL